MATAYKALRASSFPTVGDTVLTFGSDPYLSLKYVLISAIFL